MNDQNEVGGKQKPITSGILKHINISNLMVKAPQEPRSQIYKSRTRRMISAISKTIDMETDKREMRMRKDLREILLSRKYHVGMIEAGCDADGVSIFGLNKRVIEREAEWRLRAEKEQETRRSRLRDLKHEVKEVEK